MRKRICMCATTIGTLEGFITETAKYLHETENYDITLVCSDQGNFEEPIPDYLHFKPIHMGRGIDKSWFKSIKEFIRLFKLEKFDLVQYATPNAAFYASIAARICKVPIRLYCQWGIRYVGMSGAKRKTFKLIEKVTCWNSTHIRAVSPKNMQFAINEGLYNSSKACVVGNGGTVGVDLNEYDITKKTSWRQIVREKYNVLESDILFGAVGRITRDKGSYELLSAFKRLSEKYTGIKLIIVGRNEVENSEQQELIDWAKSSNSVIFTGHLEARLMKEYYSAMDVLVHPTYREGFGMVIQEAGALAVPVITTKIPGASEVMEDGISAFLIDAKSEEQLFIAMEEIVNHPDRIKKYGENAYIRTKLKYNRPIMLEFQREDYAKLLNSRL